VIYKLKEINKACVYLQNKIKNDVILISGDVGAGKTTLVKEFCKLIGVKENVNSPTYTLINQYKCNSKIVVHIDLYRVNNLIEINELGLFDYLENNLVIIEWPEIILNQIDFNYTLITIKYIDKSHRKLSISNK
jgi:tRNA threonylcarbamoyladenosine biosynthesis protein TsaE